MNETQTLGPAAIAWLAFGLGTVFGAVGNRTSFCTMGAVADIVSMGDWTRMRMWIFAMALAIIGAGALQLGGNFDVAKTLYAAPRLLWLSHLVGGLLFGVGMTLAAGCGGKTLIRMGGGNVKSIVVFLFVAISAYMTMRGLFAVVRIATVDTVAVALPANQDIASLAASVFGVDRRTALIVAIAILGGGGVAFALAGSGFRRVDPILGGLFVSLVVIAGWFVSARLGYLPEHPETLEEAFIGTNSGRAESLSFVAPYAYFLELMMFWSDASKVVTFGIAAALGVVAGSAAYALGSGNFRVESFRDGRDVLRHMLGGTLMGIGGVTAVGCTIGQGISGISTLSVGSFLTVAAIIAGSALTVKYEYWRATRDD